MFVAFLSLVFGTVLEAGLRIEIHSDGVERLSSVVPQLGPFVTFKRRFVNQIFQF